MTARLHRFYEIIHRLSDLAQIQQTLEWDQEVIMPSQGLAQRAQQLAALASVVHEGWADPELGSLIAELEAEPALDEPIRADLREARKTHDRASRIPLRLVAERAEACSLAQGAWEQARPRSDFAAFRPFLERVVALTREQADAVGAGHRYDALLDDYEPGMTEARLRTVFADLKGRLLPLLDRILGASRRPDASLLSRRAPVDGQRAFCERLVRAVGFDLEAGRLDVSAHPFTTGTLRDVRLTTRYQEDYFPCAVFGTIHEAGHGLYEQGLDPERFRDPAGQACSMGIHESQSRLWENFIGRSRPFWAHFLPVFRECLPGVLDDVSLEDFHRAVNEVAPTLVRLEADEATYNLHIILRFELEADLVAGRIEVRDLPELWRAKTQTYIGLVPDEDRLGVLQDIHWAAGLIGYFPAYALGNLYGAQFMERLRADLPDLEAGMARGRLQDAKVWLNERIHAHGRRWSAEELCLRVTGAPLGVEALMRHLHARYEEVYDL